jgi:hypothetical protein
MQPALLLISHGYMHPKSIFANAMNSKAVTIVHDVRLLWGDAAAQDTATRTTSYFGCAANLVETLDVQTLITAATVVGALRHIAPALASAGIILFY